MRSPNDTFAHRTAPLPECSGFTLVELLLVVVIVAITSAVGLNTTDTSEQKLELAAMEVRDACNRARSMAVSSRSPHAVVFDTTGNRFTLIDDDGEPVIDTLTRRPFLIDLDRAGNPLGVSIDAADFGTAGTAAIFDAQGYPLAGGTLTLGKGSRTRVLTLSALTGTMSSP